MSTGLSLTDGLRRVPNGDTEMHGSLTREQLAFYDREGYLVLEQLLNDADLRPAREAMARKVEMIAADLLAHGLIDDTRPGSPFETRLAELFAGRSDAEFLKFGARCSASLLRATRTRRDAPADRSFADAA